VGHRVRKVNASRTKKEEGKEKNAENKIFNVPKNALRKNP